MNKRIVFIEPKPPNIHIFSKFKSPRLGIFILGRMMLERGWDVEVFVEDMESLAWDRIRSADMVGISSITSTAPRAYKIADKVREMGIPVIMGGAHPTFLTDEALDHSDWVIRGEGEDPLMAFMDAWETNGDFSSVSNLSYRKNGEIVHNAVGHFATDLDNIPFPDFSLFKGKAITGRGKAISVQTSRGCPFHCNFCSVTTMFGRKYRFRSTENIIRELRGYSEERNFIFFSDDNFAANPKQTKDLLNTMIREKLNLKWSAQMRVDVAKDEELVKLMKKAGCYTVFIGFETVNPESLGEMKKSQGVEDIVKAVKVLHRHGIHIHGMFMVGLDHDNWKTVKRTVRFARKSHLTSVQFLIVTPLPGSELYENIKAANRLLFNDWSLYDAHHVVFRPVGFSMHQLQKAQMYCHKKFYSWIEQVRKLVRGNMPAFLINLYAHHLNRIWKKNNKVFLKVLDLLAPNKNVDIKIDYKERIDIV